GDFTADKVMPLFEKSFGAWKASGAAAREKLPAVEQPSARQIHLIDKPGAPQSQIRIGWIGVPRSTPDYFPLTVMNTILGGSFSSRLNTNLREVHGYSYGASSTFDMRADAGRSEEHTSELQSRGHLVCRILLVKNQVDFYVIILIL